MYKKSGTNLILVDNNFLSSTLEKTRLAATMVIFNEVMNANRSSLIVVNNGTTNNANFVQSCNRTILGLSTSKSASIDYTVSATNAFLNAHPTVVNSMALIQAVFGEIICVYQLKLSHVPVEDVMFLMDQFK